MRDPEEMPEVQEAGFGELEPVPVPESDPVPPAHVPRKPVVEHDPPTPIPPSSQEAKERFPLRDGDLVLPGGLIVHRVPRDVRVWAREGGEVWEVTDRRGKLLVLVHVASFREMARPGAGSLLGSTKPLRLRVMREGWGPRPVEVVVDRLSTDTHVYTLERRAKATDWVWAGLDLSESEAQRAR